MKTVWNYLLTFWAFEVGMMALYAIFWAVNYYRTKQPIRK
jgi:hypothetical protein